MAATLTPKQKPKQQVAKPLPLLPMLGEKQEQFFLRASRALQQSIPSVNRRTVEILRLWKSSPNAAELNAKAVSQFPPDKFDHFGPRCVFLEHTVPAQQNEDPELSMDAIIYNQANLQKMVDWANHRIRDTSDFSAISDGHTPSQAEASAGAAQPDVLGYAGPFYLGLIGDVDPKWAIFADEWVHKTDLDRFEKLQRRSPEVWTNRPMERRDMDPIAALGATTPRLDAGMNPYCRIGDGEIVMRYSAAAFDEAKHPREGGKFAESEQSNKANADGAAAMKEGTPEAHQAASISHASAQFHHQGEMRASEDMELKQHHAKLANFHADKYVDHAEHAIALRRAAPAKYSAMPGPSNSYIPGSTAKRKPQQYAGDSPMIPGQDPSKPDPADDAQAAKIAAAIQAIMPTIIQAVTAAVNGDPADDLTEPVDEPTEGDDVPRGMEGDDPSPDEDVPMKPAATEPSSEEDPQKKYGGDCRKAYAAGMAASKYSRASSDSGLAEVVARQSNRLKKLESDIARKDLNVIKYSRLNELNREYVFDMQEEFADVETMSAEEFSRHEKRIQKYARRDDPTNVEFYDDPALRVEPERYGGNGGSKATAAAIQKYSRQAQDQAAAKNFEKKGSTSFQKELTDILKQHGIEV